MARRGCSRRGKQQRVEVSLGRLLVVHSSSEIAPPLQVLRQAGWQNGEMCLRWTAARMLEAEQQFRRVIGHRDLAKLAVAVEREVTLPQPDPAQTEEAAIVAAA